MAAEMSKEPWFSYLKPRPRAQIRLFCLPYAGGGAMIYRGWSEELPAEIEVIPVQLPGRERRMRERAFTQMNPLVVALAEALDPFLDPRPFAFFGHSMGASIAYELANRLRSLGRPLPRQLLVSGRSAPQLEGEQRSYYDLPDDEFRDRLREIEGTPEAVLENDELMALMMPLLRADFELIDTYPPTLHPPFDCPVTAYGGLGDEEIPEEDVSAWREITRGPFKKRMLAGGHFFINEPGPRQQLIEAVARDLLHSL